MLKMHKQFGKIGLVLPGGFMRGAYQVGALRTFYSRRVIPHYIAAVSAGAANGAAFATGKVEKLYATYQEIARAPRKYVYRWNTLSLLKAFFWADSLLTNSPLRNVIFSGINMQDLISSPMKLDIITSDYQTGKPLVFSNKNPEHGNPDILANAILASAAVPTIFPPFTFKGHQLFDGGVLTQAPLTYAIRERCDTIFVISNYPIATAESSLLFKTIYAISKRTTELVEQTTMQRTIDRAFETNADIDAYTRLKEAVTSRILPLIEDANGKETARKAVEDAFSQSGISICSKLKVRLHILCPDATEDHDHSERFINHKIIPRLLDRGEEDARALLDRLERELS